MSKHNFEQRWQQRFEKFAHASTDAAIAGWSESGLAARVLFFKQFFKPEKGLWIDVGCGAGTYSQLLAHHDLDVIGMDYSLLSLQKAQIKSPQLPWVSGDVYALPLKGSLCRGVLCFGVMQAVEDEQKMVGELARILSHQGQLWIDGLNKFCLPHIVKMCIKRLKGKEKHLNYTNPYKIKKLIYSAGFDEVQLLWAPIMPSKLAIMNQWFLSRGMQGLLRFLPFISMFLSHGFYIHAKKGDS